MRATWYLKCFTLGMLWLLIRAKEDQGNQPNMTVCSQDSVLLCTVQEDQSFSCMNMSSCMARHEQHDNTDATGKNSQGIDVQCDFSLTNCTTTVTGSSLLCEEVVNQQHLTAIFKVTGCSKVNTDLTQRNHISDIICYLLILISILSMYLSYVCSHKIFNNSSAQKKNTIFNSKTNMYEIMNCV